MSQNILEIEFKGCRREYAANPQQFPFQRGDWAVVETDRGQDLGTVSHVGLRPELEEEPAPVLSMLRLANTADLQRLKRNRERETEAGRIARSKIREHNLEMKLVDVETQWDERKTTFFFTADGRVDFRELVKDLASTFRTRIDLRQIGARDETKKTSGYGVCGRPLCCATFLTEFKPITTQMPRDQFLPLNPSKLSGVCGRLKCCLRYELDVYREFQRNCPKVGHPVKDDMKGEGRIDKLDMIRGEVHVRYTGGVVDKIGQQEFLDISNWKPQMPKNECICTCGRKDASALEAVITEPEDENTIPMATTGAKITISETGLRYERERDGRSFDVQTDVQVPDTPHKKKKKRRGSRSKNKQQDARKETTAAAPKQEKRRTDSRPKPQRSEPPKPRSQRSESSKPAPTEKSEQTPQRRKRRRGGRRGKKQDSSEN